MKVCVCVYIYIYIYYTCTSYACTANLHCTAPELVGTLDASAAKVPGVHTAHGSTDPALEVADPSEHSTHPSSRDVAPEEIPMRPGGHEMQTSTRQDAHEDPKGVQLPYWPREHVEVHTAEESASKKRFTGSSLTFRWMNELLKVTRASEL